MVELLAPAGSKEALTAAVEGGADAVYLSGKMFGARQSAANFTDEELAEAIKFAHLRGVLIYVTVNTLVDNSEMPLLADYLKYLGQIGADAVIVQDWGVARLARALVPALPLHASTQMTVHNLEGVKLLGEMGFKRIVLARELSLAEIEAICRGAAEAKIEIETFVHGALCISYSGQCLMSSLIGGRSGNRGRCAQPCRLPYTLVDAGGGNVLEKRDAGEYLLSPRDLSTLAILPRLINAGVASLKIEGRMKRPEYVAVVVDAYRRAIDSFLEYSSSGENMYHIPPQDQKDIAQIFNRDFTTAYLMERPGRDMMSDRRPNNRGVMAGRVQSYDKTQKTVTVRLTEPLAAGDIVEIWVKVGGRVNIPVSAFFIEGKEREKAMPGDAVVLPCPKEVRPHDRMFKVFDKNLNDRAKTFFTGKNAGQRRKIFVDVTVSAQEGEPLTVKIKDADGFTAEAGTAFLAQRAVNRPLVPETVAKQIQRLGTTVFCLRNLTINIEGEIMVPVSEINEARRQAAEKLAAARLAKFSTRPPLLPETAAVLPPAKKTVPVKQPELAVSIDDLAKVRAAVSGGADVIFFGAENYAGLPIKKEDYQTALEMTRQAGKKIIFSTPRIINARQMEEISELIACFGRLCPDAVSAANAGIIYFLRQTDLPIHGDYPLNIYNSQAAAFLSELGLSSLTLSPELNFTQIEEIRNRTGVILETLVHGRLPLMVSEYCAAGSFLSGCAKNNNGKKCPPGKHWLLDRAGEKFPVVTDQYCRMHVLNAKETSMLPYLEKLRRSGIDRIRIEGKYLDAKTVGQITGLYRELLDNKDGTTNEAAEGENITRGHYFRGVL